MRARSLREPNPAFTAHTHRAWANDDFDDINMIYYDFDDIIMIYYDFDDIIKIYYDFDDIIVIYYDFDVLLWFILASSSQILHSQHIWKVHIWFIDSFVILYYIYKI